MSGRFSPEWWAHWTAVLHRPGRLDDEEIPKELAPYFTPVWNHYPPWCDGRGETADSLHEHARVDGRGPQNRDAAGARPDWPTMLRAQTTHEPTPTDSCLIHGRCIGTCAL